MTIAAEKKPFYLALMRKAIAPDMPSRGAKVIPCPECGQECWQTAASRKAAKLLAARGFEVKDRCTGCSLSCQTR